VLVMVSVYAASVVYYDAHASSGSFSLALHDALPIWSRPRPVEIAVAFDDGTALSTLVNPQRDLADARSRFGLTTADVALAPTLAEAWAVLAPVVQGHTPVGPDVEEVLALVDFELKRRGVVAPLPLGVPLR